MRTLGAAVTVLRHIGYWTLAICAVLIALMSMRFLTFDAAVLDAFLRPNLLNHPIPFWIHVTLGPLVLILGVIQFLPVTRRGAYHRWAGKLYVGGVLIAALAGLAVAPTTSAGPIAGTGFAILAVLWFGVTLIAYLKVRAGRYAEHRQWMIRSYALTCAAITLRIITPGGIALGFSFESSYLVAAWASWSVNLVIAELIIRGRKTALNVPADRSAAIAPTALA